MEWHEPVAAVVAAQDVELVVVDDLRGDLEHLGSLGVGKVDHDEVVVVAAAAGDVDHRVERWDDYCTAGVEVVGTPAVAAGALELAGIAVGGDPVVDYVGFVVVAEDDPVVGDLAEGDPAGFVDVGALHLAHLVARDIAFGLAAERRPAAGKHAVELGGAACAVDPEDDTALEAWH